MRIGTPGAPRYVASTSGGIGNLGPGLDVLGCAIAGARDEVTVEWYDVPGITVLDPGHPDLPHSPAKHTAAIAAAAVLQEAVRRGLCRKDSGWRSRYERDFRFRGDRAGVRPLRLPERPPVVLFLLLYSREAGVAAQK